MITSVLIDLYSHEIEKLKNEVLAFESDELLWRTPDAQIIPAGNQCLFIAGSLQHFIGNIIGDSGYIRNKEAEMKAKNITKERLLEEIENMRQVVIDTLEQVSKTELQKQFPTNDFEEPVTTEFFLIYLLRNLGFQMGQITLIRQLVSAKIES